LSGMFELVSWLGIYDTLWSLTLSYMILTLPFTTWVLTTFMRELPKELEEAALVDGAKPLTIITRVFMPLLWPALATTGLLAFISAWNEFLFAITFTLSHERRTGPVAVAAPRGGSEGIEEEFRVRCRAQEGRQGVRRHQGDPGCGPRYRSRRVRGLRRTIGMRKVHVAAPDRGAGGHHLRRAVHRQGAGQQRVTVAARHRDGVPVVRALSAHDGVREPRLRAQARQGGQGGDRQAGPGGGPHPPDRSPARPQAEGPLGRPAPAGGDRARHPPRAEGVPLRRAPLEPGRRAAGADPPGDRPAQGPAGRHHDLRDPRPGRGHDPGRSDRGAEPGPGRAGGKPARAVHAPAERLRRRVHRLAQDEPAQGNRGFGRDWIDDGASAGRHAGSGAPGPGPAWRPIRGGGDPGNPSRGRGSADQRDREGFRPRAGGGAARLGELPLRPNGRRADGGGAPGAGSDRESRGTGHARPARGRLSRLRPRRARALACGACRRLKRSGSRPAEPFSHLPVDASHPDGR